MIRQETLTRFREAAKHVKASTTIALWSCLIISAGLLVASFLVPPTGVIDASVLKAASLIFAFAGLFFLREAVMEGLGVKLTHGQTTIEVHDLDGPAGGHVPAPGAGVDAPLPIDTEIGTDPISDTE